MPGDTISETEVTNVSRHGLWLYTSAGEKFLSFEDFPWFRDAPIARIVNVEETSPGHYYWPDLDIDLTVDMIDRPQDYPLCSGKR
jgi:hypothetical protein